MIPGGSRKKQSPKESRSTRGRMALPAARPSTPQSLQSATLAWPTRRGEGREARCRGAREPRAPARCCVQEWSEAAPVQPSHRPLLLKSEAAPAPGLPPLAVPTTTPRRTPSTAQAPPPHSGNEPLPSLVMTLESPLLRLTEQQADQKARSLMATPVNVVSMKM